MERARWVTIGSTSACRVSNLTHRPTARIPSREPGAILPDGPGPLPYLRRNHPGRCSTVASPSKVRRATTPSAARIV